MAELMEYKCPACGGAMEFDAAAQKMKCPYCDTEMEPEEFQAEQKAKKEPEKKKKPQTEDDVWSAEETAGMCVYLCNSCGGEIVAEETTGATTCPFCGNRVVMKGQFAGDRKPNYLIPFKKNKKEAKAAYLDYLKGKKFLPKIFREENHIEEMKGVYVPFWLFDSIAKVDVTYDAKRISVWRRGDTEYTKTDCYDLRRAGDIHFSHVPADGSAKMDDALMDSIEPFDFADAVPFAPAYLAGYLAERYDVSADDSFARAKQRMEYTAEQELERTVTEYTLRTVKEKQIEFQNVKPSYVLYPVWLLSTTWNDEKFLFAMNGQTGKLIGNLPADKKAIRNYIFLQGAKYALVLLVLYLLLLLL